ncbi:MAG: RagB/SusD family nutrient uptake outer membrane protein [Bacteroidales bacterium]
MKKIFALMLSVFMLMGCEDMFEPAIENILEKDFMYKDAQFAGGLLLNAYSMLPTNGWIHSDVATDNAVSNDPVNNFRRTADGQWTSDNNPFEVWQNSYYALQYVNLIINGADRVNWALDSIASLIYADRFRGEAYGLRAIFMLHLMQHHAGKAPDGELLGVPIITDYLEVNSDFNLPRGTFQKCMEFIYADLDSAEALLPLDYAIAASSDELYLNKYKDRGVSASAFERVFGSHGHGRMTRRIAEAIRARAALFAASEAYSEGSSTTWEDAANAAAKVLNRINGVGGFDANGLSAWFGSARDIDRLGAGLNSAEVLWRTEFVESVTLERENYPPSLFGNGRINPTQNLVDAFPMANGYPISHASSGYNPQTPYLNRDARLAAYVVLNGSRFGATNTVIMTAVDDANNNNALNRVETSTRTGYYLRKLMRPDISLNPATNKRHYRPHIRFTEIFLNYAEAANEAWGPDGMAPGASYSARSVISAIRNRAAVGKTNNDPYLASITDKDGMRELIRNERRLELCFEDFRFWDLRRWKKELNETVKGVRIQGTEFTIFDVDTRQYQDYMYYGPIPKSEVLKYDALVQNQGW